ncbi:WD40-repeat-containing domain protein [Lipomyces arxii]|uniref:WD40-repeat-containing domain protein n=1 Tax=Lipomyces arxii TaxID=56418 RepID=UPI0034CFDAA8
MTSSRFELPKVTLSYPEDVFSISSHPSEPVVAAGLSTGHVYVRRYAVDESDGFDDNNDLGFKGVKNGGSQSMHDLTELWKTRRHKGSCRGVIFDEDGDCLYSVGTDLVLKQASSETGKVTAKNTTDLDSEPSALAITKNNILVGTESGSLQVFDPRIATAVSKFENLHDDYVTSVTHLAQYQNTNQFITTGSTTVTRVDIRKGKLSTSEDQEDEILSSCISYPAYFEYDNTRHGGISPNKRVPVTAVMGMSTGVLTFWTKSNWEDQQSRAILSDESLDCVMEYPDERVVVAGADGFVRLVDVRKRKTALELNHGGEDGVVDLAVDASGRIISGGGTTVKIWTVDGTSNIEEVVVDDMDTDNRDSSASDAGSDDSDDSDDEDKKKKKKRKIKKRKRGKAKNRITAKNSAKSRPNFAGLD